MAALEGKMTEDEKYVREQWAELELEDHQECCPSDPKERWLLLLDDAWRTWAESPEQAWIRAASFTRTRLQQIRDVEEEIAWLQKCWGEDYGWINYGAVERLLAVRRAALADLKRGLRVAE